MLPSETAAEGIYSSRKIGSCGGLVTNSEQLASKRGCAIAARSALFDQASASIRLHSKAFSVFGFRNNPGTKILPEYAIQPGAPFGMICVTIQRAMFKCSQLEKAFGLSAKNSA